MLLIDQIKKNGTLFSFYNGIDFDILMKHRKDGSDGFIISFIDNWVKEVQSYNRNNKLKSLIDSTNYIEFEWDKINNDYVIVYQADGIDINILYEAIHEKVMNNQILTSAYLNITQLNDNKVVSSGGAWKIQIGKSDG